MTPPTKTPAVSAPWRSHRNAGVEMMHPDEERRARFGALGVFTLAVLGLALVASLGMRHWDADLAVSRAWWQSGRHWFGNRSVVCGFLNDLGPYPAVVLAAGAAVLGVAALLWSRWRHLGAPALYLVLAFLLGPGLLVNGIMKHTWDRARPKDVIPFGGRQHYETVLTHEPASQGRSFPSGHASAAFYLCSLGFASAGWGRRRHVRSGLVLGAAWGALVGWSRIASGAHFLTDILWSATVVTLVNGVLLTIMVRWTPFRQRTSSTQPVRAAV